MNFTLTFIIVLFQLGFVFTQTIPRNHFFYQSRKFLYDAGEDWQSLTVYGPIRYKSKPASKTLNSFNYFNGQIGFNSGNESYSLYGYGHFKHNNYYGFFYPAFVKRTDKNIQLNGSSNLINNQDNHSGFGYENSWAILQIGKGKESWGAGNDIQLALSESSGTYDYFLLASNYGRVRVRYIYGFLENIKTNINRYITARGFEWTNEKSLIIGFSETVIYSGENRSFDLGYLNPISSHLEIELNNRLNIIGDQNSNSVWQIHLDYLMKKNFRLSLNFLYDELVLDPNIEIGKENGKAYSIRLAYTSSFFKNHLLTLHSSLVHVGTPTFRHGNGTNNFVHSGRPLGWYRGSDGQEFIFGVNYFNNKDLIVNISTGILYSGEENISNRIFDPYLDYKKGHFPSGNVEKVDYIKTKIIYHFKENYSISCSFYLSQNINLININMNIPID